MRLHFVLPQLQPTYGMERAAVLLMRGLMSKGVAVSGTVMSGAVPSALGDFDLDQMNLGRRMPRLAEAVPPLRRRLRGLPRDVEIVSSGVWGTVPVGAALAGSGRSFVAWEHSLLPERLHVDRRVRMLARTARIGCFRPRLVVAVSRGVARTVRQVLPGQTVVAIPNAVPPSQFVPPRQGPTSDRVRLVTTGALRPLKNYSCALSALAMLPQNFELQLAGDGEDYGGLAAQVSELNLAKRVTFLGRVGNVREILSRADVLVHPSRAETFGFSLIEAADAGVPVAALPVPAIDELIPDLVPGVMAVDTTPTGLADALKRLVLNDRPARSDFEQAWRARTAAFDPIKVSGQWVEALRRWR